MRLRTLPVSVAGVLAGTGCAVYENGFRPLPFLICLVFAVIAQICSNFANEYFDFRNGLDRKGREGFRRGVTEGDIPPVAMRNATFGLLLLDSLLGLSLLFFAEWWLIFIGIAVALFAVAYSAGPWPLSHHGLGEIAVIVFFGIVPVTFTCHVQTGNWELLGQLVLPIAFAIGLMGANVLIVNNYRDYFDDKAVGKHTSAVILGRRTVRYIYLANGLAAAFLLVFVTSTRFSPLWLLGAFLYANFSALLFVRMGQSEGHELNPLLGKTSMLMFAVSVWLLLMLSIK